MTAKKPLGCRTERRLSVPYREATVGLTSMVNTKSPGSQQQRTTDTTISDPDEPLTDIEWEELLASLPPKYRVTEIVVNPRYL